MPPPFPPIDKELLRLKKQSNEYDPTPIEDLYSDRTGHAYLHCWGYTVYRTAYGPECDDEKFAAALRRLDVFAEGFVLERAGACEGPLDAADQELWSRYYCEVIEDPDSLDGLSYESVSRLFEAWVGRHTDPGARLRNPRYCFCVLMDQETVDKLLASSEDLRVARLDYWGKTCEPNVKMVLAGAMSLYGGESWWFRVPLELLWEMWFSYDKTAGDFTEEMYFADGSWVWGAWVKGYPTYSVNWVNGTWEVGPPFQAGLGSCGKE